jgi:hypothetical protein
VGDDGDVTKVHSSSSDWAGLNRATAASTISPENRGSIFPDHAQKLEFDRAHTAQKGSPAKRTGHTLLVAAQYSQKSPENNALFTIWLADFRAKVGPLQPLPAASAG